MQKWTGLPKPAVEALEIKLKLDGFDGIIRMHLESVEKSTTYTPGTSYRGYYGVYGGYHGYGYGGYRGGYYGGGYYGAGYYNSGYTEGYYSEDRHYNVETNLYSFTISCPVTAVKNLTRPSYRV